MSFTFAQPPLVKILYRVFERIGTDGQPCGCLSYYAKPEKAFATGLFVDMVVASVWEPKPERDFMDDLFQIIPWQKASFEQREIWLNRCNRELNIKLGK